MLLAALGAVLCAVGLLDIFLTVLNYDGMSFLAGRLYRATWSATRSAVSLLPERAAGTVLSVTAPALLPGTVALWVALEVAGFGLVYYPAIEAGWFTADTPVGPSLGTALYVSGVTLTTLGYGDVTPVHAAAQALTVLEALIGFSILTLTVSYLLSTFGVLARLRSLSDTVRHLMPRPDQPLRILEATLGAADPATLRRLLERVHDDLQAYDEGLRLYPIVYYFHTRDARRSSAYLLGALGQLVGVLRFVVPAGHPLHDDPWMRAFAEQYEATRNRLSHSFLRRRIRPSAPPVARDVFDAVATGDGDDQGVERFLALELEVALTLGLDRHDDLFERDRYDRYAAWAEHQWAQTAFLQALADDLGYGTDALPDGSILAPARAAPATSG